MAIEEQIEEDNNIKGHVVQTRKRYQRDIDEEAELKELIAQRDALNQEQEAVKTVSGWAEVKVTLCGLSPVALTVKARARIIPTKSTRVKPLQMSEAIACQ